MLRAINGSAALKIASKHLNQFTLATVSQRLAFGKEVDFVSVYCFLKNLMSNSLPESPHALSCIGHPVSILVSSSKNMSVVHGDQGTDEVPFTKWYESKNRFHSCVY
jgi:hypothetical protein